MKTEKKQRTCSCCKKKAGKQDLYRIFRDKDGRVGLDPDGKQPGRGAYVCSRDCFESVIASNGLERVLRVKIAPQDKERIASEFEGKMLEAEKKFRS